MAKYSAALSHDLFEVTSDMRKYYGGSQFLYLTERERTSGCGIAGAANIVLYLKALETGEYSVSAQEFLDISREIRKYIPIIPGRGVNSFLLAGGLNRYFKKHGMGLKARWKMTRFRKWKQLEKMLMDDLPVILAIGNNFPFVWGRKELNLYIPDTDAMEQEEKVYKKYQGICGHFVIVTGIEGNCLTVSSWGKKLFINLDEYNRYVSKHSIHIYSNILEIKRKH